MEKVLCNINNCLNCKKPGCNNSCYINTDLKELINLIKQNKTIEAVNLQYNYNSIGFITGILCDHNRGCLGGCNNKKNPVLTCNVCFELGIKRLEMPINKMKPRGKSVLIIGGGVAGMVSAELLLEKGFNVSLYEKEASLGGVLHKNMPLFRYDMTYFNKWVDRIMSLGLDLHLNSELNNIDSLSKYDYVIVATGASVAKRLFDDNVSVDALKLLEDVKHKDVSFSGLDVVVLGGGNTAYDIARVVNKLGNNVSIAYRRDIKNSPASINEIKLAKEEGIKILELLAPKEINCIDDKKQIKFIKTKLVDDGGKRLNFKETDEEILIECDMVIEAIGANSTLKFVKENYPSLINEKGYVSEITNNNIFVIGDAYSGASNFANANLTARIAVSNILDKEKRTVLFGGSFNPPTIAHYEIIKYLSLNYDEVLLLPNGDSYSFAGKILDSFNHRVKMLEIMTKSFSNIKILELENRSDFKGTYHTLRLLNHPTFVLGSDCIDKLHLWKHFDELLNENNFIVFNRGSDDVRSLLNNNKHLNKSLDKFEIIDFNVSDVSSTEFRNDINKEIVCEEVYDYIIKNELY